MRTSMRTYSLIYQTSFKQLARDAFVKFDKCATTHHVAYAGEHTHASMSGDVYARGNA